LYLAGPTFHISIYVALQVNIPESESSKHEELMTVSRT